MILIISRLSKSKFLYSSGNKINNAEEPNIMLSKAQKVKWLVWIHCTIWMNTKSEQDDGL